MEIGYGVPRNLAVLNHQFPHLLCHQFLCGFVRFVKTTAEFGGADQAELIRHFKHMEAIPVLREERTYFLDLFKVVLAAPTGRAAKRMAESVGAPAQTIHRLLKWNPATNKFTYDGENRY
ncbi:MAG: AAA family ATPase, partial [Clostridia bacterium]|nr:AAA family ATPase [Clostridia bacterium]